MENLFFPARRAYSSRPTLRPTPPPPVPKSRVISIPVHFADDKHRLPESAEADDKHRLPESDRSSAAVTIQKILRGFLVRKNMQIVRKIAAEAAEIGHQISAIKIGEDAKERLRIGEMLMALLLRLDAVRGVREYRKKVIRRVIQLQEAVDSIAQGNALNSDESKSKLQEAVDFIAQGDALNSDESKSIPAGDVNDLAMDDCLTVPEEFGEEETQKEDLMMEDNKLEKSGGRSSISKNGDNPNNSIPPLNQIPTRQRRHPQAPLRSDGALGVPEERRPPGLLRRRPGVLQWGAGDDHRRDAAGVHRRRVVRQPPVLSRQPLRPPHRC